MMTHAPSTYKIPGVSDCPRDFRVRLFDNSNVADSIHRSKATGEPPLLLAFSVFFAIRDAVSSVGDHKINPPLNAPATSEQILQAVEAVQAECDGLRTIDCNHGFAHDRLAQPLSTRKRPPTVLVTVAITEGSCPRETGAKMLVTIEAQYDTIGGGHLEMRACEIARSMLATTAIPQRRLERFALEDALASAAAA